MKAHNEEIVELINEQLAAFEETNRRYVEQKGEKSQTTYNLLVLMAQAANKSLSLCKDLHTEEHPEDRQELRRLEQRSAQAKMRYNRAVRRNA